MPELWVVLKCRSGIEIKGGITEVRETIRVNILKLL